MGAMIEVRSAVRASLAPAILELWDEIERQSGRSIHARLFMTNEAPSAATLAGMNPQITHATLLVGDAHSTPDAAILHELLHLQRYWIEGIPQIVGCDPAMRDVITPRENSLEHLIVVPRQAEWGLREESFWNEGSREEWSDHDWPTHPIMMKRKALMGWLRTHIVTDESVIVQAREKLTAIDLLDQAEAFKAQALNLLDDKPRLASFVAHAWDMDPSRLRLLWFASDGRTSELKPWDG